MADSVTISDFQIAFPPNKVDQKDSRSWTLAKHLESAAVDRAVTDQDRRVLDKLFLRYAIKPDLISSRSFECPDISPKENSNDEQIYPVTAEFPAGSDIATRTAFFSKRATERFREFYPSAMEDLRHIIHVTCTGYRSPSAAQLLVAERGWGKHVAISHAYHMGCYASLPAVRMAEGFALKSNQRVDIVHTEMCGLHMNAAAHSPEQIVVQSLFADGHVKYSLRPTQPGLHGLQVLTVREEVVSGSDQDMSWAPESWGLQMNLSREVPEKISSVINQFFYEMARSIQVDPEELLKSAIFAIHPGGPKIIGAVQTTMGLSDDQTRLSKKVLFERGNMSSATLPHVWNEILLSAPSKGSKVVSFAFGPGLTVFGSVFEVV